MIFAPPHNPEAEQIVLGSVLVDNEKLVYALDKLKGSDFYINRNGIIFTAISDLYQKGINVDIVSVADFLKNKGSLDLVGGAAYLAHLVDCIPVPIKHHCKIIHDASVKRFVLNMCVNIAEKAQNGTSVRDLLDDLYSSILLIKNTSKSDPVAIWDIIPGLVAEIENRARNKSGIVGLSTGLIDLDSKVQGLAKPSYVVVAGRPGMGKTSLALKIAENVSSDEAVLVFSMEMSNERLAERLLCMGSRVDSRNIRTGYLVDNDWDKITRAADILSKKQLIIDHSSGLSIAEVSSRAKRTAMKYKLGMVVIDYIQLMPGKTGNRASDISEISRGLLALAKDLNVCMVVLSQLNRECEKRTNKRPVISDLKESGSIEQDADIVLLLYRDEMYNTSDDNPNRGTAEIIIGKGRDIGTWTAKVGFCGKRTEFFNMVL